jgi:hypothetical protein
LYLTRLEKCTLWSILTFQRCSSHNITQVILTLMWSEIIVVQQFVPTMTSLPTAAQQCVPTMGSKGFHCCTTMTSGHADCLPRRKKNATNRYGRAHKVFFAHARAWRTPKNYDHLLAHNYTQYTF